MRHDPGRVCAGGYTIPHVIWVWCRTAAGDNYLLPIQRSPVLRYEVCVEGCLVNGHHGSEFDIVDVPVGRVAGDQTDLEPDPERR